MIYLYTDGGARGNPGPGAIGIVLKDSNRKTIMEMGKYLGTCTNNEAEYRALIEGLTLCKEKKADEITCHLDSELIVKQLKGQYKVKNQRLRVLFDKIKNLETKFSTVSYIHIPREKNVEADALVNEVLDSAPIKNGFK
jgi:ribonuclease HI